MLFAGSALPLMLRVSVQEGVGFAGLLPASTHGPPDWVMPAGVFEESTNWCGFFELLVMVYCTAAVPVALTLTKGLPIGLKLHTGIPACTALMMHMLVKPTRI